MIVIAIGEVLLAPLAAFFAMMSVMMFDAPGSDQNQLLWLAFWSICAVPLALVVGAGFAIAGAVRYSQTRLVISLAVPGVAILWVVAVMAMLP